jgi:ribonuclease Z
MRKSTSVSTPRFESISLELMRPQFRPRLVNPPFADPGLYVPLAHQSRALLFDLGDIQALTARDILRVSHVFVSHAHMDHFCGFDRLLRLGLGRDKSIHLFGPEGFLDHVAGKLSGYRWNLVSGYNKRLQFLASEIGPGGIQSQTLDCHKGFEVDSPPQQRPFHSRLLEEDALTVTTAILDHGIPCLGFALEERFHINIKKAALNELGLDVGPWLQQFKDALFRGESHEHKIVAPALHPQGRSVTFRLGELRTIIARVSPGQKIAYITDVAFHDRNIDKIVQLAWQADHLFIESAFLEADALVAAGKHHLTAAQAGQIAALAEAKKFTLFHFSPRYSQNSENFQSEAMANFRRYTAAMNP